MIPVRASGLRNTRGGAAIGYLGLLMFANYDAPAIGPLANRPLGITVLTQLLQSALVAFLGTGVLPRGAERFEVGLHKKEA